MELGQQMLFFLVLVSLVTAQRPACAYSFSQSRQDCLDLHYANDRIACYNKALEYLITNERAFDLCVNRKSSLKMHHLVTKPVQVELRISDKILDTTIMKSQPGCYNLDPRVDKIVSVNSVSSGYGLLFYKGKQCLYSSLVSNDAKPQTSIGWVDDKVAWESISSFEIVKVDSNGQAVRENKTSAGEATIKSDEKYDDTYEAEYPIDYKPNFEYDSDRFEKKANYEQQHRNAAHKHTKVNYSCTVTKKTLDIKGSENLKRCVDQACVSSSRISEYQLQRCYQLESQVRQEHRLKSLIQW